MEQDLRPSRFAYAFACGIFIASGPVPPVLFMRSFAVVGFAWLVRANRLVAFLTSHLVLLPLWIGLIVFEVRVGACMLKKPAPTWHRELPLLDNVREIGRHALPSALLGGISVAMIIAVVAYAIAFSIMVLVDRRRRGLRRKGAASA
jgi:uncharacterized protein (DUF2062 family)